MKKDLLAEIQKVVPPSKKPWQVLYPGPPRSPIITLYEVYEPIGKVALVPNPPAEAGLNQHGGGSCHANFDWAPGRERFGAPKRTRSSHIRQKSTGSVKSGRDRSFVPGEHQDALEVRTEPKPHCDTELRSGNRLRIGGKFP